MYVAVARVKRNGKVLFENMRFIAQDSEQHKIEAWKTLNEIETYVRVEGLNQDGECVAAVKIIEVEQLPDYKWRALSRILKFTTQEISAVKVIASLEKMFTLIDPV